MLFGRVSFRFIESSMCCSGCYRVVRSFPDKLPRPWGRWQDFGFPAKFICSQHSAPGETGIYTFINLDELLSARVTLSLGLIGRFVSRHAGSSPISPPDCRGESRFQACNVMISGHTKQLTDDDDDDCQRRPFKVTTPKSIKGNDDVAIKGKRCN